MKDGEILTGAVNGTGIMGTCIAQTFASSGLSVRMVDIDQERLEQSRTSIEGNRDL